VHVDDATHVTTIEAIAVFPYSAGGLGTSLVYPKPFIAAATWGPSKVRTRQTGKVSVGTRGRSRVRAKG
jgi:hypothetical protein